MLGIGFARRHDHQAQSGPSKNPFLNVAAINGGKAERLRRGYLVTRQGVFVGLTAAGTQGSVALSGTPKGKKMGVVRARRGHMPLLPAGAAYQFHAARPGVVLLQTLLGRDTVERWADICQTTPQPQA